MIEQNDGAKIPGPEKCAIVALIGAPNAGKSTLLNTLLGQRLSITTHKAQTTRRNLRGVAIYGDTQIVFVDTPGIFKPEETMERAIVKQAWRGIEEADIVCLILDSARAIDENTKLIIEHLKKHEKRSCAILNKVDSIAKPKLIEQATLLAQYQYFDEIFMISALKNSGIEPMAAYLQLHAPLSPWLFDQDEVTDAPMRELAAEITREQLFIQLHEELPYVTKVETDSWKEEEGRGIVVHQTIYVCKESQKKIVIGDKATRLKSIGQRARQQIARRLDIERIHLYLHVKVRRDWVEGDFGKKITHK